MVCEDVSVGRDSHTQTHRGEGGTPRGVRVGAAARRNEMSPIRDCKIEGRSRSDVE